MSYLSSLRDSINKAAFLGGSHELARLSLLHQVEGARSAEQIAKLKKMNTALGALGGAGGLALALTAMGVLDFDRLRKKQEGQK